MPDKQIRLAILLFLAVLLIPHSGIALTTTEVSAEIMCTCGCTMVLNTCNCGTADAMRSDIAGRIERGQSRDEIINAFVSQHGEQILSSPPRRGFNLVAYIAPMLGLLIGIVIAVFLARRWRYSRFLEEEDEVGGEKIGDEMLRKIGRELEMLEEV
jgi:cytochrome c-type biogenesis protein CcmH